MRNDKISFILMNHSKDILSYPDGTGLETSELPNQSIYLSSKNSLHAHTLFQSCIEIQRMDYHLSRKATYTAEQRGHAYSRLIGSIKPKKSVPKLFDPSSMDVIVALFEDALQVDASNKAYNDAVSPYMRKLLLQVRTLLSDLIVTTDLMTKIISFQDSCDTLEARIKVMPAILYNIHWKIDNEFEIGTIPTVLPMRHEVEGAMVLTEIDTRTCIKILFVDCKFVNLYIQVLAKRLKSVEDLPTVMVLDDAHPTRDLAITNGAEIVEDVKQRFREAQQAAAKVAAKEVSAAKSAEPSVSVNELLAAFGENVKPGSKSAAKGGSSAAKGGGGSTKKGAVLEVVTAKAQQTAPAPIRVAAGGGGSLSTENKAQMKMSSSLEKPAISKEQSKTELAFQQYKAQKKAQKIAKSAAAALPIPNASSSAAAPTNEPNASSSAAASIPNASSSATTVQIPNASSAAINEPNASSSAAASSAATSEPYYGSAASYNPFPAIETPPTRPPSLVGRNARLQLQCLRFIPLLIDFVQTNLAEKLKIRGIPVPPELIRCQIVGSAAVTMLEHLHTTPFPFTSDIDVRIVLNPYLSSNLFAYSTFFKLLEEATETFLNTTAVFPSTTELYGSGVELAPPTLDFVYRTAADRALLGQTGVQGPLPPHALSPDAPCKGVVLYPIGEARNKALLKIQGRRQIGHTWDSFPVYDDIMDISTNALGNNDEWDAMKDFLRIGGNGWVVPVRPIAQLRGNVAIMKASPEFTHGARRPNRPKLDARLATLAAIERPEPRKRQLSTRRRSPLKGRRTLRRSRRFRS
jgi:hypothetical protein